MPEFARQRDDRRANDSPLVAWAAANDYPAVVWPEKQDAPPHHRNQPLQALTVSSSVPAEDSCSQRQTLAPPSRAPLPRTESSGGESHHQTSSSARDTALGLRSRLEAPAPEWAWAERLRNLFTSSGAETPPAPADGAEQQRSFAIRALELTGQVALLLVAVLLLGATLPTLFGFHQVTVYGGSMGDSLPAGSIAVTRTVDASDVNLNDVIVVPGSEGGGLPILHRVVEVEEANGRRVVSLRGDANPTDDPRPVTLAGRGDRHVFHVPWLGYAMDLARSREGMITLVGGAVATWLGARALGTLRGRRWPDLVRRMTRVQSAWAAFPVPLVSSGRLGRAIIPQPWVCLS